MSGSKPAAHKSGPARAPAALWMVMVGYLVCTGLTAWFIPWSPDDQRWHERQLARYAAPDEWAHLGYVEYLVEHRALPIFDDPDGNYEAHQPPLYYLLCIPPYLLGAALARWGGLPSEFIGSVLMVRAMSVLIGAAVIWSVYALAMVLFRGNRAAAVMAAGFTALLPMHFVNLAGVTNDGLAELVVTVSLLWICKLAAEPADRTCLIVGLLSGTAMLVKSNALFLFFVAAAAVILGTRSIEDEAERGKRILRQFGLVIVAATALCGWWWVRNQILYGDPLAHRVFVELFTINRATPEWFFERGVSGVGYLLMLLWGTAMSFWGVFGQAVVYMPPHFYLLGWVFSLAVVAGLIRSQWVAGRLWSKAATPWLLSVLALVFVIAFYLRFNMIFYQVQARYLFAAIGPIACLFVAGWFALWARSTGDDDQVGTDPLPQLLWWGLLAWLVLVALWHLRPGAEMMGLPFVGF